MKEARCKRLHVVWLYLYEVFQRKKFIEKESRGFLGLVREQDWLRMGLQGAMGGGDVENALKLNCGDGCTTLCI